MMPGLTLNTEAAASKASRHQPPGSRASASSTADGGSSAPPRTFQSTTPIPVPIPMPYTSSREQQQPAPQTTPARSESPARPTYSPITPPLNATEFPARPTYTHSSHANATAVPPPPPEPIDFDSNPDVLALKSAISILQIQRKKAERDMATLGRVKGAALAEPEAFVRDLTTGRVHVEGDRLFGGGAKDEDSDSSGDGSSDSDGDGNRPNRDEAEGSKQTHTEEGPNSSKSRPANKKPDPPPWAAIPKPQNIVRCPPINWSQYAVVGESLDKLHDEQVRRPAQGTPATLTPGGRFEFKGGDGKQERYPGVAAPYAPGKDRIDPKSRGPSKR